MTKAELRTQFRNARTAISRDQVILWSQRVADTLKKHPLANQANTVFTYESMGNEVETTEAISHWIEAGKVVIAPGANSRLDPECDFKTLSAPGAITGATTICSPEQIARVDLFIVPGIVWDLRGYRIGFGGGYFDKLLSLARPDSVKVGLAFEFQVIAACPHDQWDVPVDEIITESRRIVVPK